MVCVLCGFILIGSFQCVHLDTCPPAIGGIDPLHYMFNAVGCTYPFIDGTEHHHRCISHCRCWVVVSWLHQLENESMTWGKQNPRIERDRHGYRICEKEQCTNRATHTCIWCDRHVFYCIVHGEEILANAKAIGSSSARKTYRKMTLAEMIE